MRADSVRKESIKLSKYTKTPIYFWLNMPLVDMQDWIADVNDIIREENAEMQKSRKK